MPQEASASADADEELSREERIRQRMEEIREGGPEKYRKRLKDDDKLFVRERLRLFFDDGPDFEDGLFANANADDQLPADGMVTGVGTLDDRKVFFQANDYTVKAGSMADKGVEKFLRTQERALRAGKPMLYLVDSSGARITDQSGFFAQGSGIGKYFYNHSILSGKIPQVAVLYGPCVAGAAYTPVFCDVTIMVEEMSAMCIASPRMVEMVTGEEVSMDELGGVDVHAEESGSCHLVAENEEHAAMLAAQVMSYLPDNCEEQPPRYETREPGRAPAEIADIVPEDPNAPFDVRDVITALVDGDSFLELSADYAPELVTGWARLDGRPVGIVANNAMHKAGAIFPDSADKAAEFITKCDAYNIPLVFLCDTPGFMVGKDVEQEGILKRGKKFIYATSTATVPKIPIVARRAYGAGLYAMCGLAFEPEALLGLPSAEIAVMGPEAAVNAVYRRKIDEIEDPEERKAFIEEKRAEYREDIDVEVMGDELIVDHIVPPEDLRQEVIERLDTYEGKEFNMPDRKHGTVI
ncbi:propionyl-CoA carboxylase [Thermoplasmatales archaeon SW_10_69_26]|nr:MAG: propionyl-CoA carboxylase [Thermoplasmatales archaeon SW_10_69_26]